MSCRLSHFVRPVLLLAVATATFARTGFPPQILIDNADSGPGFRLAAGKDAVAASRDAARPAHTGQVELQERRLAP